MRAILFVLTMFFAGLLAGCAAQTQRVSDTRWPEAVLTTDRDSTHSALISTLAPTGWQLESTSPDMVRYQAPDPQAHYNKAAYGCTVCPDPYISLTFFLSDAEEGTRVTAQYWRVIPKFGGVEGRHEMTRSDDYNMLQELLWQLGEQAN